MQRNTYLVFRSAFVQEEEEADRNPDGCKAEGRSQPASDISF